MTTLARKLKALDACSEAIEWAREQPSLETAWQVCQRGDWMLWLLGRMTKSKPWSDERKSLVRCACACASLEPKQANATRQCIKVTEAWCDGKVTMFQVIQARADVYATDAAYAIARTAATCAARAAAHAACAADADACATDAAGCAADAAACAADAAGCAAGAYVYAAGAAAHAACAADAAAATRQKILNKCAGIVRMHFPVPPTL